MAQPLTVPGAEESFASSVRQVLAVPVGAGGLAVLVGLAGVAGRMISRGAAPPWALIGWSVPAAFVAVAIVRATAEWCGPSSPRARVAVGPGLLARGLLLTALAAPALLLAPRLDPAARFGLALGVGAVAPLVLARVASGPSLLGALDLRWYGGAARALGGDGVLAGALSAVLLCFAAWLWGAATEGEGEIPPLWRLTVGTVAALSVLLLPRIAGLLVRAHAESLGVELQARGRRLAWPGAVPRKARTLASRDAP
jgi:hypothetical protein